MEFNILEAGDWALKVLSGDLRYGVVSSVFNKACNILMEDGHIVALQRKDACFTPLSLTINCNTGMRELFSPGTSVQWDGKRRFLTVGGGAFSAAGVVERSCLYTGSEADGPAQLALAAEAAGKYPPILDGDFDRAVYRHCLSDLPAFGQAVLDGDPHLALAIAADILGMGKGLTPSGDDMLCGFCAAARLIPCFRQGFDPMAREFAGLALKRTGRISAEFILCMVQYYYLPSVISLFKSAANNDWLGCLVSAEEVSRMGSSSGRDHLLGISAAAEMM